jgi:selenoprotein W-related protein
MNAPSLRPRIVILYCTQCQWLLRAAWMAQELLSTFSTDLGEVVLQPGTGGIFQITYNGDLIWDRLDPGRPLGHIDGHAAGPLSTPDA